MTEIKKIRVFVSSRSEVEVFSTRERLTSVRRKLQDYLHSLRWSVADQLVGRDQPMFDVWIHENETGAAADRSTLDLSLDEVDRADVVIVLYDGQAGSAATDTQIGICHAELQQAVARRPGIVFMVRLVPLSEKVTNRDREFRAFVESLALYQKDASSQVELHGVVVGLLQDRVADLASRGSTTASRKLDRGEALQWNRLNLAERQAQMRLALGQHLQVAPVPDPMVPTVFKWTMPGGAGVLVKLDAIPAATSQPAAREMVGQPFLRDHELALMLEANTLSGPIHIIACHRSITESQVAKMLGTTDSMVVASDFGIYATDHVQKIQMVFLAKCSDAAATGLVVRRFLEWLVQSGEGKRIALRADSRQRILAAVAREQTAPAPTAARKTRTARSRKQEAPL